MFTLIEQNLLKQFGLQANTNFLNKNENIPSKN